MIWGDNTKPTPANLRKRLTAAADALAAAVALIERNPKLKASKAATMNAGAWTREAYVKAGGKL